MTRQEAAEQAELGTNEAKMEQTRQKLAEAGVTGTPASAATKPSRKTRSDKGSHKAPKAKPGQLTAEQVNTLRNLFLGSADATREADAAADHALKAQDALEAYLDALQGKQ